MTNNYYVYGYLRLDTNTYFYIGKGKDKRYLRLDNRNNHFNNILNKTECVVEILYDNLSEDEAFELEKETIQELVFEEGYSIDIKKFNDNKTNNNHLVNCTWGGEGTSGLSIKQSEETISKRVNKNTGQKRNKSQKENLSKAKRKYLDDHPEEIERLRTLRIGFKTSDETKQKLSEIKKGKKQTPEQIKIKKEALSKIPQKEKDVSNYKRSYATGTHIYCIELNKEFPSLNKAVKFIKEKYNILFNKHSLSNYLKGDFKYDWYGEININGVLTKLHWKYI